MRRFPVKKDRISFEDFSKIDIRVGRITDVKPFAADQHGLYKVEVDLGDIGYKWTVAQVTASAQEKLVGSLVAVVANLPSEKVAGFRSEILILGARNIAGEAIALSPRTFIRPGEAIY